MDPTPKSFLPNTVVLISSDATMEILLIEGVFKTGISQLDSFNDRRTILTPGSILPARTTQYNPRQRIWTWYFSASPCFGILLTPLAYSMIELHPHLWPDKDTRATVADEEIVRDIGCLHVEARLANHRRHLLQAIADLDHKAIHCRDSIKHSN